MLEIMLRLDSKGIVPCDNYSTDDYIRHGTAMFHEAMQLKVESPLGQAVRVAGYDAERVVMPREAADKMKSVFRTDISWLPVFSTGVLGHTGLAASMGREIDLYRNGIRVPALLYADGDNSTLLHEARHFVHSFAMQQSDAFEEAVADYGSFTLQGFSNLFARWKNASVVRDARKRLEDCTGPNAGYVLLRLTKPEMMALTRSSSPLRYLKDLDCLRHQIIKEKSDYERLWRAGLAFLSLSKLPIL